MPSINRIRVNNVKYNFGTQFYDDFTMRMYGKNTLYDLANGGGKSVLMLLLLQNMIPNCTLDDKQPIEKLFRTGNGNTTIHSLVEWKLDSADSTEGYKYMTTGFCARKAKEAGEESGQTKDVASIEYFNYCIFYREYNKNDIVNLPLVKDGERISFSGLKSYLKELEHRDMALKVMVFERKGEYQRFISDYGLHESQWEIVRGINKTEGHVRTYFETNYKTTRRVVEDLLIEEIIEKAFLVKTEREEAGEVAMANMLMDIKEQLAILAKKKKDISGYDHQIELIEVLSDKVTSFIQLYEEQTRLEKLMADICVTGEEFAKRDEEKMEELANKRDAKRREKDEQRRYIECLKVAKDKNKLAELNANASMLQASITEISEKLEELEKDLNLKEGMNEYIDYLEDKKKYTMHDAVIKNMMADSPFDQELLFTFAYNIKMRMDVAITDIRSKIKAITDEMTKRKLNKDYQLKLLAEARVAQAVADSTKKAADEEIIALSEQLSAIRMSMNNISFAATSDQKKVVEERIAEIQEAVLENGNSLVAKQQELNDTKLSIAKAEEKLNEILGSIAGLETKKKQYDEAKEKLDNIRTVYGANEQDNLEKIIADKIISTVLELSSLKEEISRGNRRIRLLSEGRLIAASKATKKVMDYLETRHGISAMYGMDYLSALPKEKQLEILEANPELPYGILVKEYDTVKDDPNILTVDTDNEIVNIYDMESIFDRALLIGDNVLSVHKPGEFFTDEATKEKLAKQEEQNVLQLKLKLELKEEMLETYRLDQAFVIRLSDSELVDASERLANAEREKETLSESIKLDKQKLNNCKLAIEEINENKKNLDKEYEVCINDLGHLDTIVRLSDIVSEKEAISEKCSQDIMRLEEEIRDRSGKADDNEIADVEDKLSLEALEKKLNELTKEWEMYYKPYYNLDTDYEVLTLTDDEIKARFVAMLERGKDDVKAIEDKKLVMDTLKVSMERSVRNLDKRGLSLSMLQEYEHKNLIYFSDEQLLDSCRKNIENQKENLRVLEEKKKENSHKASHLEGSIEYAISNIQAAFGAYEEQNATASEIISNLKNGEELLKRLEQEAKNCDEMFRTYKNQQGYMLDLYKDVKRIVTTHNINLEKATVISEGKDKLRDMFESNLLAYDRSSKQLDKAKNELLRFKGNTATSLDQMEVYELAATIRNDVVIPEDYEMATELVNNLKAITEYIKLERDRVEKSLVDMETIKANFEEQCLQRCLDVRTELDKLPKLSRIVVDGEAISMVGLSIPYVKDEFLKQRMSDYIDRIVAQADDYDSDKDRIKFIRGSLALKKLFGVIVTDMNGIKLSLYKRERIKEQSRYLRYEEAVGSTGQSQGIYIQFLVSIINYISGMYQVGNEDTRTKTIFIDNPFGAAKDVYIWEPIFALLAANNVQLIVPARGATPAITGRFDVNYILGQQMVSGRQLTVVCDYTSKADQEELEYKDLDYEQVSFDFI